MFRHKHSSGECKRIMSFQVHVDSAAVPLPFAKQDLSIEDSGSMYVIATSAGLMVKWAHLTGIVDIHFGSQFNLSSHTEGLCGEHCFSVSLSSSGFHSHCTVSAPLAPFLGLEKWCSLSVPRVPKSIRKEAVTFHEWAEKQEGTVSLGILWKCLLTAITTIPFVFLLAHLY